MRFVLAATLLAGFLASPAAAQRDGGYGPRDADSPRFSADDDDGPRDRDRREFGSRDPDEIMPRRRDRDRDVGRRRDWDDRGRRDAESRWDDRSRADRYDRYDRYGPPPYGPGIAPPAAPSGVFVVPPPIPGARNY
ncbi:hypothetical protein SAMN02799631_01284 [Methylobacterium sp. 174MFSha1.1]|uniref:hypothetical protein n=1 Tax=Methylobacterium sp. 174MFSha1.1 TaxID=1502749 RepID=UPI0008E1B2C2|nr:hypothetical protein [Methylobacterium sp. 174MFSha1.1]SFU56985.1 hypothetical protein SAMN02799631_01284 [Methylobacterium sp. 174MFSha1.1]